MITTWLFEFFHALRGAEAHQPQAIQDHYRWYLDLWTRAEQQGFDGIFFSEHHFGAGYAPSPNLLVANVAARTTTLRLGVLGVSTPYSSPWRVVEEFAMLDHLTGGRFEPGLVSGIPPELGFAGISADVAMARHETIATAVEGFMRDGSVTAHGGGWAIDDLAIFPSMYQRPGHVWTACRSRATAEVAARRGWKVCTGFNSTESIADMFDGYRVAATEAGHPATADRLGLRRMVTFVDDASQQRFAKSLTTPGSEENRLLRAIGDFVGRYPDTV